jgi:V-type H+-transporting ATPase subunit a
MEELTLEGMRKHIDRLCEVREGSTVSWLAYMELYTKKEREVYRALSTTQVSKNLVRFHLYIPTKELPLIIQPKINLPPLILNVVESDRMPPSKFDTNVMMEIPQAIVNTYGVPSYSEINPAPFYIVTFGFFIGVMFGDVGHMLMAIPLLIHFKANLWFWTVVFWMGYCGLIYNEFFGLNFGIFSSCYSILQQDNKLSAVRQDNCVFSFGVDSVWKVADNEMAFTNSLKMKVAVILGVVHMMFGLFIKLYNNLRQRQWVDLLTLTLPQMVFMSCTFLYMDYLILYKWNHAWADSKTAPSIISTMISVYVNMARDNPKDVLFWPEERKTERLIVALAIICVPIMLLGKTLVICFQRRKKSSSGGSH